MIDIPTHVFREYDIRGFVDTDLNEDFAFLLGRAFGELVAEHKGRQVAVGHDCRHSSPGYARALSRGIQAAGVNVIFTSVGPTPQLYFAIFEKNLDGGIQVTGSHNPSDMNGFKICLGKKTLAGDQVQDLLHRMTRLNTVATPSPTGEFSELAIREDYITSLAENVRPHMGPRKIKVVVDAGNGVGGLVGPEVLRRLGCDVVELYCEPDGDFPNHHPDPTVLENIADLAELVRKEKADFGIGWDGDADRIGVVDEKGDVIFGDMLLLIYGRSILKSIPGATIIGDVKCSSLLFDELKSLGANAIMWKTGHSLIKSKLLETKGELAGEMSGHIFFKNRFFGFDDGIYAAARLVEIISHTTDPVSSLLSDLPPRVSTPEIRSDCPDDVKFIVAEKAKTLFAEFPVSTIDGARIEFPKGWGLVRASNTQPVLVFRFEAENEKLLKEYQDLVESRIEGLKAELRGH